MDRGAEPGTGTGREHGTEQAMDQGTDQGTEREMAQGREPGMEYGMAYDSPYLEDETHHLPAEPTGGRHELNTVHLVAGLVMLGIVVVWLLERFDLVPTGDLEYLLPVPFLLAGGLGLLAWVLTGRRSG